ncbi:MAG: alkaline phosphatase family protein [Candidatus Tumulicola sp.]
MTISGLLRRALGVGAVVTLLAGCGGTHSPLGGPGVPEMIAARPAVQSPIEHVIVVVQQNRSFDSLFMGFPGADTTDHGYTHLGRIVPLKPITLETNGKPGHGVTLPDTPPTFFQSYDSGKMNGFDLLHFGANGNGPAAGLYPYAYVSHPETRPYWELASQYALADHMFSTEIAGSFAANQVLIAGSTVLDGKNYVVGVTHDGGCDAPRGTRTILSGGGFGPRPCFTWKTMADLLDAKHVAWKYYSLLCSGQYADKGCRWDAFEAIKSVRYGPDWTRNVSVPNTNVFDDLKQPGFPAVAWITPSLANSDYAMSGSKSGPAWVASIVDAVKHSSYWKSTAVVVVWGDWGGYYDHVPPPFFDNTGLGFRVPMIVVSPYVKRHSISHTQYEFGSILKFIEQNWGLGSLGNTDERATSIAGMFDFTR